MAVNCGEHRDTMILLVLRKKLTLAEPGSDEARSLEAEIAKIEEKLGLR